LVTVTWNSRSVIRDWLSAVEPLVSLGEGEVIVVDNASSDGTADWLASRGAELRLIRNGVNRGFARAVNQGILAASGRVIVLLNPDALPEPGSVESLVEYLDGNEKVGIVGGELVGLDGARQPSVRAFPGYLNLPASPTSPVARLMPRWFPSRAVDLRGAESPLSVDSVAGAFMAVKREVLKTIGLFDEGYYLYVEDMDLCYRAKAAGWQVHYLPGARARHYWGHSMRRIKSRAAEAHARSMYRFWRKFRSPGPLSRVFLALGLTFYALAAGWVPVDHGRAG